MTNQIYDIKVSYNNLSESYIYPYRIAVNEEAGIPTSLLGCSNGVSAASIAMITTKTRPRYVVVEWESLLHRKAYRARIDLDDKAGQWWHRSPFRDEKGRPYTTRPLLVIQWRGGRKVAAMLVASSNDFSRGRLDLGEAEGEEIPRPEWGPRLYATNKDYRRKPGDEYWPGTVYSYRRKSDEFLTPEGRYGCPRLPDGRVDESRLPPEKLPFLIGAEGEYIPCDQYSCEDKKDLIKELKKLGRREYKAGQTPPPIEFRDAPNPRPAW